MRAKYTAITALICGVGLSVVGTASAYAAQSVTLGNVTVWDYGRVNPATAPDPVQPTPVSLIGTSVGIYEGQPGAAGL